MLEQIVQAGQEAGHHRRGRRRRSPGNPAGQQAARHLHLRCVKAPGFGDRRKAMLQDIAILTGGTVISSDLNMELKDADVSDLGRAGKGQDQQRKHRHRRRRLGDPEAIKARQQADQGCHRCNDF